MTTKKLTLCTLAFACTLMTGCVSVPKFGIDDHTITYDETKSRALNLAEFMRIPDLRDTKAPEGYDVSHDSSLALGTIGWGGAFHTASGSGFLPGTSDWGKAFGAGFGMSLLVGILSSGSIAEKNNVDGYWPAADATSAAEARQKFVKAWAGAVETAAKKFYPNAKINNEFVNDDVDRTLLKAHSISAITIVDESMGCKPDSQENDKEDWCAVAITGYSGLKEQVLTSPILGESIMAYRPRVSGPIFYGGKKQGIDWIGLMVAAGEYLPEKMVMYLAPQKKEKYSFKVEYKNPPMIIEKGRVNFFVKPKAKAPETPKS